MKTKTFLSTAQYLFIIVLVIELASISSYGQRYRGRSRSSYGKTQTGFTVGILGSLSAPSIQFKSDIEEFDGLTAQEEGASAGLVGGFRGFDVQLIKGIYSSSNTMMQRVDMRTLEGAAHIYPLQFMSKKMRFIEPYLLMGGGEHDYKMYGVSDPKPKNNQPVAQTPPHLCAMPGMAPPPDPGVLAPAPATATQADQTLTGEAKYIGTVKVTRFNTGIGMVIHIYGKRTFLNLFSEYKIGLPMNIVSAQEVLINTRVNTQKTIQVGLSFGLR
jgi:hypothetical protein